jgi:hypothetical protein
MEIPMQPVPPTVKNDVDRDIYHSTQLGRATIKEVTASIGELRSLAISLKAGSSETPAYITLAYRALEEAGMWLGKALQSLDGGVSVYDKATTSEVREIGTPRPGLGAVMEFAHANREDAKESAQTRHPITGERTVPVPGCSCTMCSQLRSPVAG